MSIGVNAWRTLHSDRGILENKIERRTLRRVIRFSKPHRRSIGLFLAGTVLDAGLVVVPPLLMQRLVDRQARPKAAYLGHEADAGAGDLVRLDAHELAAFEADRT